MKNVYEHMQFYIDPDDFLRVDVRIQFAQGHLEHLRIDSSIFGECLVESWQLVLLVDVGEVLLFVFRLLLDRMSI